MRVILIRHGKTPGNEMKRHIGRTDESLSEGGRKSLCEKAAVFSDLKEVDPGKVMLFSSPKKRCKESAAILFPWLVPQEIEDLTECDFGDFENKNYKELSGNPDYQAWIDSGGTLPFPGGEDRGAFAGRSVRGFLKGMQQAKEAGAALGIFVVHGGSIMAVLEALGVPKKDYYDWQLKNGEYIEGEFDFQEGRIFVREKATIGKESIVK